MKLNLREWKNTNQDPKLSFRLAGEAGKSPKDVARVAVAKSSEELPKTLANVYGM